MKSESAESWWSRPTECAVSVRQGADHRFQIISLRHQVLGCIAGIYASLARCQDLILHSHKVCVRLRKLACQAVQLALHGTRTENRIAELAHALLRWHADAARGTVAAETGKIPLAVIDRWSARIHQVHGQDPFGCFRRMRQISWAKRERRSAEVARIIATAPPTSIASLSPFIASTAVTH